MDLKYIINENTNQIEMLKDENQSRVHGKENCKEHNEGTSVPKQNQKGRWTILVSQLLYYIIYYNRK
jgi:hypothetical protein